MRRLPTNQPNFTIHRERDARAISRLALLFFSAVLLAGGFIHAAGQHFAAVRFGYESEKLRLERDRLLDEQRRLLLAREEAAAPGRLESEARKLGLQPVTPTQIGTGGATGIATRQLPTTTAMAAPSSSFNR